MKYIKNSIINLFMTKNYFPCASVVYIYTNKTNKITECLYL